MDLEDYIRFAIALVFVLGLIGLLALVARRFGMTPRVTKRKGRADKRVRIVDVTNVDGKRRLILVGRDDTEHLILLGPNSETVIETGIETARSAAGRESRTADEQA